MAIALTGPACIPFEVYPVEDPPAPPNYPPVIVEGSISPQESFIELRRETDFQCNVELVVGVVRDEDIDDVLEARWYVDYDFTEGASNALWKGNKLENREQPERVGERFSFNVADPYATPGVHTVEVVITESKNFVDLTSRNSYPNSAVATHRWFIDVPAAARDFCRGAQ